MAQLTRCELCAEAYMSAGRFVERPKTRLGPISYDDMYEKIKNSPEAFTGDKVSEMWGYNEGVDWATVRKRTSDFNKWLKQTHGLIWQSTVNYRLYPAEVAEDYRRKPKKPKGPFDDPSA
jgi:hypothetical protein